MSIFAILLAAGESTRMGQNKALLPWQGKSLLEYQIAQLRQTPIKRTIVVLGFEADKLLPLIEKSARVSVVVNPDYPSGRCSSIKAGMKMLPAPSQSVLILAIDQPRPHQLLAEIIKWHRSGDNLITVPVYQGRRGHPPIFSRPLFPELLQVSEETMGLRHILLGHQAQVSELPTSSPVALIDLNNPGDYEKALSRWPVPSTLKGDFSSVGFVPFWLTSLFIIAFIINLTPFNPPPAIPRIQYGGRTGPLLAKERGMAAKIYWDEVSPEVKALDAYVSTKVFRAIAKRFWVSEVAADFSTYEGKALAATMIQNRQYAKQRLL